MVDSIERKKIHLGIGEILVVQEPAEVMTVLGSCVSVCLFDKEKMIAGMNHYMLPKSPDGKPANTGRFGDRSIPELLSQMVKRGASLSQVTAKIFGGAQMLSQFARFTQISTGNIELAQTLLKENNIKIIATDLGGNKGRKILFQTDTGRVLVRQVGSKEAL